MRKTVFLFTLLSAISCCNICAQRADERLAALIGQDDWFVINDRYPSMKADVQTAYLKDYTEAMLAHYFGHDGEGAGKLSNLIEKHGAVLGDELCVNLTKWIIFDYELSGNYADAVNVAKSYISAVRAGQLSGDTIFAMQDLKRLEPLAGFAAPQVVLPEGKDVVVDYSVDFPDKDLFGGRIESKGGLMFVPMTSSSKTVSFVIDTSIGQSFITRNLAEMLGIKVIDGVEFAPGYGVAIVDELVVGNDVKFKNVLILVADIRDENGNEAVDARLGMDFLRRVPEMQIDTKAKKLIFPAKTSAMPAYGVNLKKDQYGVRLRTEDNSGPINVRLATCYQNVSFGYPYYEKRAKEIEAYSQKKEVLSLDNNNSGATLSDAVELDDVKFKTCGKVVEFDKVVVPMFENTPSYYVDDAYFGMGFINKFDKVTINMRDMFMKVE